MFSHITNRANSQIRSLRRARLVVLALAFFFCTNSAWAQNLSIGDKVPDFTLTNQNGSKTSLSDYKGKGVVLSFLYTQCPFPDKCPMLKKKLGSLADVTQRIGEMNQIQVMAITIDPKNDTPEVLKSYAQGFDKKHKNWLFLTGSEADILKVAGAFGVLYWNEKGIIEHNMKTVFIGPDQTVQIIESGSEWKAGEFAARIKRILD